MQILEIRRSVLVITLPEANELLPGWPAAEIRVQPSLDELSAACK